MAAARPSVVVGSGESVTCTFTNVKRGSLTVVKKATGGDATFPFVSQALGNFSLSDGQRGGAAELRQPGAGRLRLERERA